MIDPKKIRENWDDVKAGLDSRNYPPEYLDNYKKLDEQWREVLQTIDTLKNKRNSSVPKGKPIPEELTKLKTLSDEIKQKNEVLQQLEEQMKKAAQELPNIPLADVPKGKTEEDNVEVRKFGVPKDFEFKPKPHDEIGKNLGVLDFETAAKVTGSRFVYYKGLGAKLERSLINFMLNTHVDKHDYQEILPPVVVNSQSMLGTGQLPKFADDSFQLTDTDYWLSPTAEVQLTNMYRDSIIPEEELPKKVTAQTICFRKEAGSYGKDVAGIIRQHQFNKVELVKFVKPENSERELELLLGNAEKILQELELPYRVVCLCTGDLGFSSAKTYDIEVWMPSQGRYREISSCSNFLDFQSRRAMIRYRSSTNGKVNYLHTLNGSGLAVGRTFAAVIENYQNADGTVTIPERLRAYMEVSKIK
jgi:seryl-tRNA synthetase